MAAAASAYERCLGGYADAEPLRPYLDCTVPAAMKAAVLHEYGTPTGRCTASSS